MKLLIFVLLAAGAAVAAADDSNNPDDSVPESPVAEIAETARHFTRAKTIKKSAPHYPQSELRRGREAWVHVTYCVDESGNVQNVTVLDSIGSDRFESEAVKTVQNWEYEPATQDGKPAWQSRNEVLISFALSGDNKGASRKFINQYRKLGALIEAGDLEASDALFWDIYNTEKLSLYELGKLWSQRVRHEAMAGDVYRTHMALTRATASHGDWIDKDSYVQLLSVRAQLEIQLGKYYEAIRSYRDLVETTGEDDERVLKLQPMIESLEAMIAGDKILGIPAEIRPRGDCKFCNDSWDFTPVRNNFTLKNIQGSLESIDMRCDHKRFESAVSDQVEWDVPEAWGQCHIQIYGEPGTTFDVFLLPAADG